jgi:hypothetical protein
MPQPNPGPRHWPDVASVRPGLPIRRALGPRRHPSGSRTHPSGFRTPAHAVQPPSPAPACRTIPVHPGHTRLRSAHHCHQPDRASPRSGCPRSWTPDRARERRHAAHAAVARPGQRRGGRRRRCPLVSAGVRPGTVCPGLAAVLDQRPGSSSRPGPAGRAALPWSRGIAARSPSRRAGWFPRGSQFPGMGPAGRDAAGQRAAGIERRGISASEETRQEPGLRTGTG